LENETSSYAVLLSKPVAHDPMVLAKVLAAVRKTPFARSNDRGQKLLGHFG